MQIRTLSRNSRVTIISATRKDIRHMSARPRLQAHKDLKDNVTIVRSMDCVCGMWASSFTHTSTRSLYEDSSRNEHWIVHPKIGLQGDLLPSIQRGLLCKISSDWR